MAPSVILDSGKRIFSRFFRKESHLVLANCWFCNNDSQISACRSDEWFCPRCNQYNGFTEDGDYNIDLQGDTCTIARDASGENLAYAAPGLFTGQSSLMSQPNLCETCSSKQTVKMQKLNSFEPLRESYYKNEFKGHKDAIEDQYRLCPSCELLLTDHLNTQAKDLRTLMLDSHLQYSKSTPTHKKDSSNAALHISFGILSLQVLSFLLLSFIMCGEICKYSTEESGMAWLLVSNVNDLLTRGTEFLDASFWEVRRNTNDTKSTLWMSKIMDVGSHVWINILNHLQNASKFVMDTRSKSIHIASFHFLLQTFNFIRWQTRVGLLTVILSSFLLATTIWVDLISGSFPHTLRVVLTAVCWVFNLFTLIYAALLYCGFYRRRKRKRIHLHQNSSKSTLELTSWSSESSSSSNSTDSLLQDKEYPMDDFEVKDHGMLDRNLNAMSLGSSCTRATITRRRSVSPGSYWSTGINNSSTPNINTHDQPSLSPLVAMGQRPLIIPATLNLRSTGGIGHAPRVAPRPINTSSAMQESDISMDSADDDEQPMKAGSAARTPHKQRRALQHAVYPPQWSAVKLVFNVRTLFICSLFVNLVLVSLLLHVSHSIRNS